MQVYVDSVLVTTWTSSGTTNALEGIDLYGTSGQVIEVTGVLGSTEWLSIVEVSFSHLEQAHGCWWKIGVASVMLSRGLRSGQ